MRLPLGPCHACRRRLCSPFRTLCTRLSPLPRGPRPQRARMRRGRCDAASPHRRTRPLCWRRIISLRAAPAPGAAAMRVYRIPVGAPASGTRIGCLCGVTLLQ